jgi:quinol monooxygenase YgiN
MGRLAIFATIEVKPGTRDEAVQILLRHRERCLKDEPGTLQFEVLVPSDKPLGPGAPIPESRPNAIMLYEVYQDAAAFGAHWNGASLAKAREEAGSMFVGLSGIPCNVPGDSPY